MIEEKAIDSDTSVKDSQQVLDMALAYINSKSDTGIISMHYHGKSTYQDGANYHISHGYNLDGNGDKSSTHFEVARGGSGVTKSNAQIIYRTHSRLDTLGGGYANHEFRSISVRRREG